VATARQPSCRSTLSILCVATFVVCASSWTSVTFAQERSTESELEFSFRYTPWEDVIEWFAEEAGLSIQTEIIPEGTFNYTDSRGYTVDKAMDLLNQMLLLKGYTLVTRDRILMVLDLEDEIAPDLVRELVSRVAPDDLDKVGEFSMASCLFPVEGISAVDAQKQIEALLGPQGSIVVMPQAKQILVTEIGRKLRTVRDVLKRMESFSPTGGGEISTFRLNGITASEVLIVARQMLNLPEGTTAAEDASIRIASDPLGGRIFVTGDTNKVRLVKQIVKQLESDSTATNNGEPVVIETPQIEMHTITTANPDAALRVLQTLFAGDPVVRLEIAPNTGHVIAMARPSQHATIKATIAQLERDPQRIEVVPLQVVDPQIAVLAITKLFGAGGESPDPKAPKVDADLINRNLLVMGTDSQIKQIKQMLGGMGETLADGSVARIDRGNIRLVPLFGGSADDALQQIQRLWPTMRGNRLRVIQPPTRSRPNTPPEQTPENPSTTETPDAANRSDREKTIVRTASFTQQTDTSDEPTDSDADEAKLAPTDKNNVVLPEVVIISGPSGLTIASEDQAALNELERLLSFFVDRSAGDGRRHHVFYLSFIEADVASTLLTEMLVGSSTKSTSSTSNKALESLGGVVGSLSTSSTATLPGAAPSIIADARLNLLVVEADASQIERMSQLLKIIDQQSGPVPVQTTARVRMLYLENASAEDAAEVVKAVFADRIVTSNQSGGSRGGFFDRGRGGSQPQAAAQDTKTKMTVGVDTRKNALVISAPDPLFEEVERLVAELDDGIDTNNTVRIVNLRRSNPEYIREALTSILGDSVTSSSSGSSSSSSRGRTSGGGSSADDIRRRIEFFRAMRGGGRGGPPGGDRGGRGGDRGGRGGDRGGRPSR